MESLSEFLRRSADDSAQRTVEAAQIVIGADPVKPEEAAADMATATDFAKLTGSPTPPLPVVREHRNVFAGLIEEKRRAEALSRAPKLADWLRDPTNAAISKDDLDNLSGFEVFARGVGEQAQGIGADVMRFGGRISITADQAAASNLAERNADRIKSLADIYQEQRAHIGIEGQLLDPVVGPFGDLLFTGTRFLSAQLDNLFGNDTEAKAAFYQQRAAETSAWVNSIKMPPAADAARNGIGDAMQRDGWGEQAAAVGEVIARDPVAFVDFVAHTVIESAPFIAAAIGVGATTRNPNAAMATLFAGSTASATGEQALEFVREAGHDLTTPEGALAAIRDPKLMADAQQRGLTYGLFVGAIDAMSGGVAGEVLSKSPLANMLLQTFMVQPVFGAGGEALGQAASGQPLNLAEIMIEAIAEIAAAPVEVAGFGMERIAGAREKAASAPATATTLQDLAQAASASKVRERSPDKFREILNGMLGDGAKANMFVPAEAFATYFQSLGLDPYDIADSLTGVDPGEFDLAMQSGGSVRIPTATWAADMAGGEHDQFVIENAAFAPGDFTVSEAAAFEENKADLVNEAWALSEAERRDEETYRPIREQEYDALVSQLRIAGRATDVAVNEALPMVEFRRVMAERMGLDPEEFAQRFPMPEVRGAVPDGMQLRDVDALSRTLAEARTRRALVPDRGPSLLEFISSRGGITDPGGELSARDASVIKRGRGKKTLRIERKSFAAAVGDLLGGKSASGHGFDDMARMLVEAGYMGDDPLVLGWLEAQRAGTQVPDISRALLDAIDRELRGEPVYATEAAAPDGLDGVEEYLAGLGVSLDDSDAAIRSAIENDQRKYAQDDSRQYDQSAVAATMADVQALADELGVTLDLSGTAERITVSRIVAATKGEGAGSRVMVALTQYADATGKQIALTPSGDFGGTVSRLKEFYRRLGFVENKGRNKDFGTREEMIREPQTSISPSDRLLFQADASGFGAGAGLAGGAAPRGSIAIPANGAAVVNLFASADLSTFLHETGHYFLSVMQSASREPGPIADDFSAVKDWWHAQADDVAKDAAKASGVAVSADDVRMALDAGTTGKAELDAAIDVGMQEQFARGFEAYLMEGKAPSIALRSAFEKFRAWLISIYRRALGLNVAISDEMRAVFGRMIATDGEIAVASADISVETAIPAAADLGMTEDQHSAYVKLHGQAKDEAAARLLADTMAPIRRERDKEYRAEKKKVRAEVERNVNAEPVYRAIEWMTNRRWLAGDAPEGMSDFRLSKSVLVERYGEGVLATLNANRGKQPAYSVDGGLDPDDAAGWFGFTSGDALVKAIERAPNRVEAINAETEKVMRERHGDPLTDGTLERKAMAAVHNDKRAQVLALELKTLNEVAGRKRGMTAKEAGEAARRSIAGMRTRDAMDAGRWLAAERKAGQEVARLMGTVSREKLWVEAARRRVAATALAAARRGNADVSAVNAAIDRANATLESTDVQFEVADRTITTKAGPRVVPGGERTAHVAGYNENVASLIEAKRRQMLNHALYTEALAVAEEVDAAERLVTRLSKSLSRRRAQSGKQTISNEALDAIAEQIDRYDFRRMSGPAEGRRGKLVAYIEWMRAAGRENELAIPRAVMEEANRVPYKTLSVERLRGVVDTLKNLESTGRRWQTLRIKGEQREFDASVSAVVSGIEGNIGSSETPWVEEGWVASAKGGLNQYLATFTTASTIIRRMDGRADLGPIYELLKGDIDRAAYDERDMRAEAAGKIEKLYSVYSQEEQRQMAVLRSMPEFGGSFSKWNVIAMALNMGNAGNLNRLTNKSARKHLTAAQVETAKAMLDKRDWDFVQSIWDYLDTYRPLISERQKRVTGVEPEWVEASPVVTPHGTYRGGYYPIKYASKQGGAATPSLSGEADIIQSMQLGGYAKAATKNGHLEARTANVQQSLLLDVGVIATHSNEVIHDLAFSEPIVNTWRLLNDKRVSDAMLSAGMQEQGEALKLWLKDAAVGQVFASDFMSKSLRNLRSGFTVSRLALNATTALLQPTGLFQSATVVGKRRLANAIISYTRNPAAMVDEVLHRSRIMNDRRTTFQKDLMDMVAETNIASPKASGVKRAIDKYVVPFSLLAMTYTQFFIVDVPTWAAAFAKGLEQFGGNQTKAAEYADMTINRAQGSGLWSERSNIERGTLSATVRQNAFVTLFTTLGSYFFAKMNLLIERTDRLRAEPVSVGSAVSYAADVSMLLAAEAAVLMLVEMGKEALLGDDDDDEDENPAMNLGVEALKTFAAGLPGIRDAVSVLQGFSGGTYASLLDLITAPGKQIAQGEVDAALVKSIVNLTGIVTRLPASQANRIIDAGWRDFEGEDVAVSEYLFGRPR